jgi:hypothetical protein
MKEKRKGKMGIDGNFGKGRGGKEVLTAGCDSIRLHKYGIGVTYATYRRKKTSYI